MLLRLSYSFRRELIDHNLAVTSSEFQGTVLDLGGKKIKKRGTFCPPENNIKKWIYFNFDFDEQPDVRGDAHFLPFQNSYFDWLICTEVMEYVTDPAKMISEMRRVLKPSGKVFLTCPFLYQIHGKPHDLQRYTDEKLKSLFLNEGFAIEKLASQGHFFLVVADFIRAAIAAIKNGAFRYLAALCFYPDCLILKCLDQQNWVKKSDFLTSFTTGYLVIAKKVS